MITKASSIMRGLLKWTAYAVGGALLLVIAVSCFYLWRASARETQNSADVAPRTGHFVHAGDVEMYVQEKGPTSGPAVLLVHAAGGWSGVWEQTMNDLAKRGYHGIAIDLPPLGYSSRPDTPRYSRTDQAKRIIGVLDALHVPRAVLVGHSFGARAVAQAAIANPTRISGVVFVDAAISFGTSAPSLTGAALNAAMSVPLVRRAITATTLSNPQFTKTLLDRFVADPASATPYWVGIYQEPLDVKGTTAATADWLPELLTARDSSQSSDPKAYAAITAPVLLIWGEADTITPLPGGRYLASLMPQARLVTMPGVGHLPPIENTDAFDGILLKFLDRQRF